MSREDWEGLISASGDFVNDIQMVSETTHQFVKSNTPYNKFILIGTVGKSPLINQLVSENKLDISDAKEM